MFILNLNSINDIYYFFIYTFQIVLKYYYDNLIYCNRYNLGEQKSKFKYNHHK